MELSTVSLFVQKSLRNWKVLKSWIQYKISNKMQLARLKIYAKLQFEILGYWRLRKWEKFGLESRIEYEEPLSLKNLLINIYLIKWPSIVIHCRFNDWGRWDIAFIGYCTWKWKDKGNTKNTTTTTTSLFSITIF